MKKRHQIRPWNLVASLAVILVVLGIVYVLVFNPRFQWDVVGRYLFAPQILQGLWLTVWLTLVVMALSLLLGLVLALMRLSQNRLVQGSAFAFIWFFRGTPALVQLIFWYNLSALFPSVYVQIPFGSRIYFDMNAIITPILAAILAFTFHMAAYTAEIIRGGLLSVDAGQREAAQALGYSGGQTLGRIVLPQTMRVVIPPITNETISMLKSTSLVSVISVTDLLHSAQLIYARNYEVIPLLIVASTWYLALVSVLSLVQARLEKRYGRGFSRRPEMSRALNSRAA